MPTPFRPLPDLPLAASYCGEIIEAGTARFVAQCPRARLHDPPALGTFVKVLPPNSRPNRANIAAAQMQPAFDSVDDPFADPPAPGVHAPSLLSEGVPDDTLFALVCAASTGGADLGRRPSAYGLEEDTLAREQPQIFDLLSTEFVALPFGYVQHGRIRPGLPPRPPRLHAFVDVCDCAEARALSEAPDFVRQMLHASGDVHPDELIAACLTHVYECRDRDFPFLVRAGKQLAALLRDDPDRLAALLRKLEP